jgi:hypothetical protein
MVFLVIPLSGLQPLRDKIDIPFGRPDAGWRLLLKRVEDTALQRFLLGSQDTSHVILSQFWYNHASRMSVDPRLDVLPTLQITAISSGAETTLVTGIFRRRECVAIEDRGWLFVSETESSIADIITLDDDAAGLDVPNWSLTNHLHEGAVLPWLDSRWQARDLAFLLDQTREWQRVNYRATDAVVFAKNTLRCTQCGWTGSATGTDLQTCPKCSGQLRKVEIFGHREAAFPLDADARVVETRTAFWDHDHCLICDVAIGRDASSGYRESSFAGGPNSVGIWLCERCFDRYVRRGDFSFLVRSSADAEPRARET